MKNGAFRSMSLLLLYCLTCTGCTYLGDISGSGISDSNIAPIPSPTPMNEVIKSISFDELGSKFNLPSPSDYPVSKRDTFTGTPIPPIIVSKRTLNYRSVIREGAEHGPNFAGHHTIVTWGAGLGSFSVVVVDARTGKISFAPFESVSLGGYFQIDKQEPPWFRKDSKLFVFVGCPGKEYEGCTDWNKDGLYFYEFDNGKFKFLKFVKRDEFE